MAKIYVNQTALRIQLTTDVNVNDAAVKIKFFKPDGTPGEFVASILNPIKGIIYYDVTTNDIDQAGDWIFWAHITFNDNTFAAGTPTTIRVYEEGS